MIVFGTRPEVIKLAPLIAALKESSLKHRFITVSTSQHTDLLTEQLNCWKIIPDYFIPNAHKGKLARMLSHTLSGLQDITDQVPSIEYIIVQGDTNTSLAAANFSFLNRLKLVHIEAGLRTYDYKNPFPEEFNRAIATKAAYFHFAPTETAKENLLKEGVAESDIMVIGNTGIDALHHLNLHKPETRHSDILITLHRRENIDNNYLVLAEVINELAGRFTGFNFKWITHPACSVAIRQAIASTGNIEVYEHLPYDEFVNLYGSAKMIVTDSGGVTEEAIHLGLPVVIFRKTTERTEAISEHYPMIVSLEPDEIMSFFTRHIHQNNSMKYSYGDGHASEKIVEWLEKQLIVAEFDVVIIGGGTAGMGYANGI